MFKFNAYIWVTIIALFMVAPVHAGPYTDDLGQCLIESTTTRDRNALVRWLFASAAAHPAVSSIIWVTPEQLDESHKAAGELFNRILFDSCREETRKALKYEGEITITTSFEMLGRVAGQQLFGSPEVSESMSGIEKYLDEDEYNFLLESEDEMVPE